MITPEMLAKPGTEHAIQSALFCKASQNYNTYPELRWLMFAVPNGGDRNKIVAANMVKEGVKSGVHDILILVPRGGYYGLCIEMKTPKAFKMKNHNQSNNQMSFARAAESQGYATTVQCSWESAWGVIVDYMTLD